MASDDVQPGEFSRADGLALSVAYLEDPSNVPCPKCGPGHIEVVSYVDPKAMEEDRGVATSPDGAYTVILFCYGCERAAALDLTSNDTLNPEGEDGE